MLGLISRAADAYKADPVGANYEQIKAADYMTTLKLALAYTGDDAKIKIVV